MTAGLIDVAVLARDPRLERVRRGGQAGATALQKNGLETRWRQLSRIHQDELMSHVAIVDTLKRDTDLWPLAPAAATSGPAVDIRIATLPEVRVAYMRWAVWGRRHTAHLATLRCLVRRTRPLATTSDDARCLSRRPVRHTAGALSIRCLHRSRWAIRRWR
jgi:hypothetical protein